MAFIDTQARPAGEVQQKVGRLKLSEAVRVGSKLRGECSHCWQEPTVGTGCALVAACEATGLPYHRANWSAPIYKHLEALYPESKDIISQVPTLMDGGGYSREQVAEWLEAQGL